MEWTRREKLATLFGLMVDLPASQSDADCLCDETIRLLGLARQHADSGYVTVEDIKLAVSETLADLLSEEK